MTMLAANKLNVGEVLGVGTEEYSVASQARIYNGAIVAINSNGFAEPASDAVGWKVPGIAVEEANNSAGADGAINVTVQRDIVVEMDMESAAQHDVGQQVYVKDDQTVQNASNATNNIAMGEITKLSGSLKVIVDMRRRILT